MIGLLIGGIDFSNLFITLKGPHLATLEEAQKAGAVTLNVGLFLNAVIQFLIVAMAIFWMVKALTRLHVREDEQPKHRRRLPKPKFCLSRFVMNWQPITKIRHRIRLIRFVPAAIGLKWRLCDLFPESGIWDMLLI